MRDLGGTAELIEVDQRSETNKTEIDVPRLVERYADKLSPLPVCRPRREGFYRHRPDIIVVPSAEDRHPDATQIQMKRAHAYSLRAAEIVYGDITKGTVTASLSKNTLRSNPLRTPELPEFISSPIPTHIADIVAEKPRDVASFNVVQEWDGYVVAVHKNSFRARLTDITHGKSADQEEVEIPLSELDDDSRKRLTEGQLIRWSIGYRRSRSGQKDRFSRITVRRLPAWTREEIDAAKRRGREISRHLKGE